MLRQLPNAISATRVGMSFALLFIETMSPLFIWLYVAAFITDCIDGNIARKLNACSEFGKKLDSIGDLAFASVVFIKVLPWMHLPVWLLVWLAVIVISRIGTMIYMRNRAGRFVFTHSIPNKIVTFMAFILGFFYLWFEIPGVLILFVYSTYDCVYEWIHADKCVADAIAADSAAAAAASSH